jgi:hypothetical protein
VRVADLNGRWPLRSATSAARSPRPCGAAPSGAAPLPSQGSLPAATLALDCGAAAATPFRPLTFGRPFFADGVRLAALASTGIAGFAALLLPQLGSTRGGSATGAGGRFRTDGGSDDQIC